MKYIVLPMLLFPLALMSQNKTNKNNPDTLKTVILEDVSVTGIRTVKATGHMPEMKDGIIYAGKKNEVIITDSMDANKAINNTRQILGRIPGLNIVETESSGFTANGIATRGLNPVQSIEMNTRQNGYNISGDIYGYNEAYYLPPMEAVNRIEMVRGAAALQFGSQFGGLVNYVLKDPPVNKKFEAVSSITQGSFGLFNSFTSLGGRNKKLSYYAFLQYRNMDGYRPNSQQWQLSGYGKLQYAISDKSNIGFEYSLLRNRIQMPGGLTDSLFAADPRASTRSRNWLKSPWNIMTGYFNLDPSNNTHVSIKMTYLFGNRSLVWRNEDGGPEAKDEIDPVTLQYVPREVGIEAMKNITSEIRITHNYPFANGQSTFAAGARISHAWFKRNGGGEGTTNSDFDLSITGNWGYDLAFNTTNLAPFIENIFRLNNRLSITPGFRFEYLNSQARGYKMDGTDKLETDLSRSRYFPLFGVGVQYKTSYYTNLYANISQAYRPIEYSQLQPFGVSSRIDKNLKDANGFNADLGYRGTVDNYLNFDFGLFYMAYNNRIGVIVQTDPVTGNTYSFRTNVANSVHKGIESYVECNLLKLFSNSSQYGLSVFHSFSWIDARYTSGEYKGNRVEAAAKTINRIGLLMNTHSLSTTLQWNHTGDAFGDASNAYSSTDPVAGYIPAYTVLDASATWKFRVFSLKGGINNIAGKNYFTRRTDEYPGPGIIPAIGRSFYLGITLKM
ncbi:MAG: TonB-dependent receptor [Bacteroidota bacterium]|nr:TonB-dependent receptor [Bacteroidota bacterium]